MIVGDDACQMTSLKVVFTGDQTVCELSVPIRVFQEHVFAEFRLLAGNVKKMCIKVSDST